MILFVVYGYAIYRMVWYIPSWLGYLNLLDILIIGAYTLVMGMFEILIILFFLLGVAFVLPAKYFRSYFAAQSFIILCISTVCAMIAHEMLFQRVSQWDFTRFVIFIIVALATGAAVFVVSYVMAARLEVVRRFICAIGERMTIFIFVYLPLFVAALVVIVIRNWL